MSLSKGPALLTSKWFLKSLPLTLTCQPRLLNLRNVRSVSSLTPTGLSRYIVKKGSKEENIMSSWIDLVKAQKFPCVPPPSAKRMMDSYIVADLPFSKDQTLKENYINFFGDIRLGKVQENLDALAGRIAYEHAFNTEFVKNPVTIVTASVDKVLLLKPIPIDRDLRMSGHVSWVGNSSMEVSILVQSRLADIGENWDNVLITNFVMVSRNPRTNLAAPVPQLLLESDEEKRIFARGQELNDRRLKLSKDSLTKNPPQPEELSIVHELLMSAPKSDVIYSSSTTIEWTKICQPQEKNVHNKIFGGYLMREAFELAFSCGYRYCKTRPLFLCQDSIQFKQPVEIGSVLMLKAKVVRSRGHPHKTFQISVIATVIDPANGKESVTNVFQFIFFSNTALIPVLPESYLEAMQYIDAARRQRISLNFGKVTIDRPWLVDPSNL